MAASTRRPSIRLPRQKSIWPTVATLQAEEILQDALSKLPNRQDIRLKLLEIYASRGDLRSFETTGEMQSIGVNKDDSIWMRVVELSAGFGPKNPLAGTR